MPLVNYSFTLQTLNRGQIAVPLTQSSAVFVLGANGVGKSTLMHNVFQQNFDHCKRILAHRQTWFTSNALNMTAHNKRQTEENIRSNDRNIQSRWRDTFSEARSNISIFDLINSQNVRARNIAEAVDNDDLSLARELSNAQAPLQAINEILALSNIPVKISLEKNEQLFASKNGSELYSVAELSDGERNALLICADVLTSEPNHLIILDEPERHLHRSIISPLLTSLFQKRPDCAFVISTHDVLLPIDHPQASVLLVRGCQWQGKNINNWDADLLNETNVIPSSIKSEILGAKRKILFVEGESESLDRQIYQLIFPEVSVIPQNNCVQVEKSVEGVRGTDSLHWIDAYGLIDADDRTQEQIQALLVKGIVALKCYSVESLYYDINIVRKIAQRCAELTGADSEELFRRATESIIPNIRPHKERLCARLCEKRARTQIMQSLPKHTDIQQRGTFSSTINLGEILQQEEEVFDELIDNSDLNGLITRYPVRETPVLNNIALGLGLTRDKYESAVRKLIVDDAETKAHYQDLLSGLRNLIYPQ